MTTATVQRWRTPLDEHQQYDVVAVRKTYDSFIYERIPVQHLEQDKDRMRFDAFTMAWHKGYQVIEEQWETQDNWNLMGKEVTLWMLCERRKVK